jgi:Meiotically Up-regulated Gene 113 (MUG113) protein
MSVRTAARVESAPGFVRPNTGRDPTAGRVIAGGPHEFEVASEPQGFVYALLDRDVCQVKIGFTMKSARSRQRDHERRRGRPLELLGIMHGGRSLERAMHARFAGHQAEREWFGSEIVVELLPLLDGEA